MLQNIPRAYIYVFACLINVFTLIPGTLFGYMAYHIIARLKRELGSRLSILSRGTRWLLCSYTLLRQGNPSVLRALSRRPLRENGARVLSVAQHFPAFAL